MHRLVTTIDGRPFRAAGARFANGLRGYYTFEFGPFSSNPFGMLARPVTLAMTGDGGDALTIVGVSRSADAMIAGHSRAGLFDVASRSHRFESSKPTTLLASIAKDYKEPPPHACTMADAASRPVEAHDQTDFEFLAHALPTALIVDDGSTLRIASKAVSEHVLSVSDLAEGAGTWRADVTDVALSAAAHALDPGGPLSVAVGGDALKDLAAHPISPTSSPTSLGSATWFRPRGS